MSSQAGAAAASAPASVTEAVPTIVGVDVGVRNLLVAAPADAGADVEGALVVDGGPERALFDELHRVREHLQSDEGAKPTTERRIRRHYRARLRDGIEDAVEGLQSYLDALEADVVAIEDLGTTQPSLAVVLRDEKDVSAWILPTLLGRIEDVLGREGYRIERVDRDYTTRACHHCEELAHLEDETIRCTTGDCPVGVVGRDRSAAVSIARRAR